MKLLANFFLGLSGLFLLATVIIVGWTGCEQLLEPRIYRGADMPADVVIFAKAYPPGAVPLLVKLTHNYGWLLLAALTYGCFKASSYFDSKTNHRMDEIQSKSATWTDRE